MATSNHSVQEMQGLYGPFTIAERVVQKIWLRRDFLTDRATLTDGRKLEIRSPGSWNLLAGPDFHGARLRVDGRELQGDVEVHFHVSDWRAHGHEADPAYGKVVLHVVMFPSAEGEAKARRADGWEIPTLVLLPLLHRSLEEQASDDALESVTERDASERIAELLALPGGQLRPTLLRLAESRWNQKLRFARLRIDKLGWTAAAHQTALEILGYRHNRSAMLAVAAAHPLGEWAHGLEIETVYQERAGQWQLQGGRPANHPRLRLRQYLGWVARQPAWPDTLRNPMPAVIPRCSPADPTILARKQAGMPALREDWAEKVAGLVTGGSRLDTLICDGFLPLAASETGRNLFPLWFHWYMGDVPVEVRRALRETGIAGQNPVPFCHGWGQGLLGWLLEREASASG